MIKITVRSFFYLAGYARGSWTVVVNECKMRRQQIKNNKRKIKKVKEIIMNEKCGENQNDFSRSSAHVQMEENFQLKNHCQSNAWKRIKLFNWLKYWLFVYNQYVISFPAFAFYLHFYCSFYMPRFTFMFVIRYSTSFKYFLSLRNKPFPTNNRTICINTISCSVDNVSNALYT